LTRFNLGMWFALCPGAAIAAMGRRIGWVAAHRFLESGSSTGKLVLQP
jgi:hypothetical protein